jgi:hypothetical protein
MFNGLSTKKKTFTKLPPEAPYAMCKQRVLNITNVRGSPHGFGFSAHSCFKIVKASTLKNGTCFITANKCNVFLLIFMELRGLFFWGWGIDINNINVYNTIITSL